jgi:hypothetical protein
LNNKYLNGIGEAGDWTAGILPAMSTQCEQPGDDTSLSV